MPELPDLSRLSDVEKDTLILAQFEQMRQIEQRLTAIIHELSARVQVLEAQLRKDSHNSSKPPSSDGLAKKPKSLRESSGRNPGGQAGHEGTTLKRVATPDVTVRHPLPKHCARCGAHLGAQADALIEDRRQVFDLVQPVVQVTEHLGYELLCRCGQHHRSIFPANVTAPVQYGPVIKSTLVYLTQGQLLPMERTAQIVSDLFGVKLSAGSVHTSIVQAAQTLAPSVMQIGAAVIASPVVHFDETGQRVGARLRWLHSAGTPLLTWYGAHDKRGKIAMDDFGILPIFKGVAVHDGWASYRDYACTHALCNAHHLRELIFLEETTEQTWPRKMIKFLRRAKAQADAAKRAQRPLASAQLTALRRQYKVILAQGEADNPRLARAKIKQRGRIKQSPATNLLLRLREHADDVLRFLTDARVPFDNNLAERDIRMPKLKQKTSGCFRTVTGAESFCTIRSYLATLRKQGRNVFHALTLAFQGNPPDPLPSG
jgi:transposase